MAFYYQENPSNNFSQDEYIFENYSTDYNNNFYGEVMGEEDLQQYPSHQKEVWEQEESEWVGRELESGEGDCQGFEGDGEFREEPEEDQWIRVHWYGDEEQDTPYGEPISPQWNHYTIHCPPAVKMLNWNH